LFVGSILIVIVLHVTLLTSIVIFRYDYKLTNLVSKVNSFFYNCVVLTELEERCFGLILRHRLSSIKELLIDSHSPPMIAFFSPSVSF
jgi:hypothetical protein